jgi:hypothetical protein
VSGIGQDLLVPVPAQLFRKVSPLGLYYARAAQWGNVYTEDVGDLFEQYVGRQLRQSRMDVPTGFQSSTASLPPCRRLPQSRAFTNLIDLQAF